MMKKHYETESTDEQKRAGLVSAIGRWKKDPQPGREYMDFSYHAGDTTDSPVIPPTAKIYRDRPAPKVCVCYCPRLGKMTYALASKDTFPKCAS